MKRPGSIVLLLLLAPLVPAAGCLVLLDGPARDRPAVRRGPDPHAWRGRAGRDAPGGLRTATFALG